MSLPISVVMDGVSSPLTDFEICCVCLKELPLSSFLKLAVVKVYPAFLVEADGGTESTATATLRINIHFTLLPLRL